MCSYEVQTEGQLRHNLNQPGNQQSDSHEYEYKILLQLCSRPLARGKTVDLSHHVMLSVKTFSLLWAGASIIPTAIPAYNDYCKFYVLI